MTDRYIAQCESEALHLSGTIQPFGALLIADAERIVTHASENIDLFLGIEIGNLLDCLLPPVLVELADRLPSGAGQKQGFVDALAVIEPLDVMLSRDENDRLLFELFRFSPPPSEYVDRTPPRIHQRDDEQTLPLLYQSLSRQIAEMTGFDRVMFYRFSEEGDGEVLAEIRRQDVTGSYLGLRFPASDVPRTARQLYLKNSWRMIPDVRQEPLPILSNHSASADLSYADLRSVASVHRIYLTNMNVRASLSFPIVIAGELFGLVACHHRQPRTLGLGVLLNASRLVGHYCLAISEFRTAQRIKLIDGMNRKFHSIRPLLTRPLNFTETWPVFSAWLLQEFQCDGAMLCVDASDSPLSAGLPLETDALSTLDEWFTEICKESFWQTESFVRDLPDFPLSASAGALALKLRYSNGFLLRLYLTRREHIYEVAWGGNPDKPVEYQKDGLNIAPRRSFEKWLEKRMGHCRPWTNQSKLLLLKLHELLLGG